MLATPSVERRTFFQHLIQLMRLPRGSIGFWPVCVPDGDILVPDAGRFWQGVMNHGAQHVVSFGEQASDLLDQSSGIQPRGISLHRFPSVHDLACQPAAAFLPQLINLMQAHNIQLP